MKSLTLYKQTRNIQLGHLYEHIFCDFVTEYLFNKGVYASVDYVLDAKTYHGGVIVIEFAAYTQEAMVYIDTLNTLRPAISESTMHTAWNQLESEKQMYFGHSGSAAILGALNKIDASPWVTFEELDVIDVNDLRRHSKPFYISTDKLNPTKSFTIELSLKNPDNMRELLPLANRIFSIIGTNLQFFLTRELGIYFDDESIRYDKKEFIYKLKFKTYPEFDFDDKELRKAVRYVALELDDNNAFKRLCNDLKLLPKSREYWLAPPIQWLYESSYQVVGAQGWKRIATDKNTKQILSAIHAKAKFGKRYIEL